MYQSSLRIACELLVNIYPSAPVQSTLVLQGFTVTIGYSKVLLGVSKWNDTSTSTPYFIILLLIEGTINFVLYMTVCKEFRKGFKYLLQRILYKFKLATKIVNVQSKTGTFGNTVRFFKVYKLVSQLEPEHQLVPKAEHKTFI